MADINHSFLEQVTNLLEKARRAASAAVDMTMVYAYFETGRLIFEEEQSGKTRAEYGKYVIPELSKHLSAHLGKGYSVTNLKQMRKFYITYSGDSIGQNFSDQLIMLPTTSTGRKFPLGWSHYLKLMRIENIDERHFYEIEAYRNHWGIKELERQFDSSLYERLALSRDKAGVMELAKKGQIVEKPSDAIKDPYVLEFLGLKEESRYSETDLETRIIDHLQEFLMEMGKGFTFVGRQVRFTFDEDHFRVDLVLYNRLLRCFVLIDLKAGKLKHQDLGQMQMYVNYYDRYEKQPYENPTVGILLCAEKNDNMVELTLPKDSNIYASEYKLYLPDKELLQEKLREWIDAEEAPDYQYRSQSSN